MTPMKQLLFTAALILSSGSVFAQETNTPTEQAKDNTPQTAATQNAVDMPQAAVGDHWSYDIVDDITGAVRANRTWLVTDVSPKDITCRVELAGSSTPESVIIYDPYWDIVRDGGNRWSPHNFGGVQLPLEVGKSWTFKASEIDTKGQVWKKSGQSRVTGKETVVTKAGSFDAFVVETKFVTRNGNDASPKSDFTMKTWYSPVIDHWVKRSTIVSQDGHVVQNDTVELTSYGRRKT